jgi:signal transduction histidine kinase
MILINTLLHGGTVIILRLTGLLLGLLGSLYLLIEKGKWQLAGHLFLLALCSLVWTNIFLYKFGIHLVILQITLIIISSSFYILGKNWGIIYSLVISLPIITRLFLTKMQGGKVMITPQQLQNNSFMLALVVNFVILIVMHYEFFKSFYQSHIKEKELNSQLQSALSEAQEATKLRADFLSSMSHELRTPLHAVIGMINVLSIENPRKEQEENLAILRFSAENLLALINDTLDFSKMNADKVTLNHAAFNLNQLLENIYTSFRTKAEQKGIDVRLNIDSEYSKIMINGDQNRLTQILNNLISNAVKFTDKAGIVEINITTRSVVENQIFCTF